jgi:hypothetical protein
MPTWVRVNVRTRTIWQRREVDAEGQRELATVVNAGDRLHPILDERISVCKADGERLSDESLLVLFVKTRSNYGYFVVYG